MKILAAKITREGDDMSIKNRCLVVLMMTFSLVNVAYAKNEQPYRVVNMNDIADDGNQNVKFINKRVTVTISDRHY
ncbi:hypothetical protein [Enterobacter asburiae]|uniref:hypothetical protein n=1 Tax=Enterobacter asburiae TaxID=61645 RepID=UPI00388D7D58